MFDYQRNWAKNVHNPTINLVTSSEHLHETWLAEQECRWSCFFRPQHSSVSLCVLILKLLLANPCLCSKEKTIRYVVYNSNKQGFMIFDMYIYIYMYVCLHVCIYIYIYMYYFIIWWWTNVTAAPHIVTDSFFLTQPLAGLGSTH